MFVGSWQKSHAEIDYVSIHDTYEVKWNIHAEIVYKQSQEPYVVNTHY